MKEASVKQDEPATGTSLTLLERVKHHDQAAWERLVSLYTPLVYRWCYPWGLQPCDMADVCQDVFEAVARSIANFRHDRQGDTFRGWLRTITRNKLRDRKFPPGGQGPGGSDALGQLQALPSLDETDEEGEAIEQNMLYRRAVELVECSFEPKTRKAFWLRVAGRSAAEVSQELGISEGAVHIAKSRILKRLKDEFRGLLDTPSVGS